MLNKKTKSILEKQHYGLVGKHSAVQICRWTKKSILNQGYCYKQKFYGIKSHRCCQMSPSVMFCQNNCIHCWRAIRFKSGFKMEKNIDNPDKIFEGCIEAQKKLLSGFKGNKNVNMEKFLEAQEPSQFAISLIGEPMLYPKLHELVKLLRKKKISSFIVSNGLCPEVIKKLEKENALPTQLYISINSSNKKEYLKWHKSQIKNSWEKFNKSLELINKLTNKKKTRTVLRMTLVKNKNMKNSDIKGYCKLIQKAMPDFIETKSYMAVGSARERLGYETMPYHEDVKDFSKNIVEELKKSEKTKKYKILDEKKESRVVLIGKDRKRMKIKKKDI
jgi:tRNA wybutosine-synthesizing protein 1